MKIERKEKELLTDQIRITFEPADYVEKVEQELKKFKKKVQVPGFRLGFAPDILIRKQYKSAIVADVINEMLQDALFRYITENQLVTLGNPLISEGEVQEFNPKQETNYVFCFDIGRAPEVDARLSKDITLTYRKIPFTEENFQNYYNDLLTRHGKSAEADKAGADVMIYVEISQVENGEKKKDGIFKKTYLFFNKLPENVQKILQNISIGQSFDIAASEIFPDESERKGILNSGQKEEGISDVVLRVSPLKFMVWKKAEPNQELYDKIFKPGEVQNEEEFKARLKAEIEKEISKESDRMFIQEIKQKLLEHFDLPLPDAFLKRWMKTMLEKPMTEEEYSFFARKIRWDIIVRAMEKRYGLTPEPEELKEYIRSEVVLYLLRKNIPLEEEYINTTVQSILNDEEKRKEFMNSLLEEKIVKLCKEHCTIVLEEVKKEAEVQ